MGPKNIIKGLATAFRVAKSQRAEYAVNSAIVTVAIFSLLIPVFAVVISPIGVFADHDPFGGVELTKVVLCHWDESGDGAYKSSGDISVNAAYNPNNASSGHNGHPQDIIPPFHFKDGNTTASYLGLNWSSSTEDIWNSNGNWHPGDAADGACLGDGVLTPPPSTGTITVNKIVVNDNGGTSTSTDFNLFVGAMGVTNGVAAPFASGTYAISETGSSTSGYTATFSGDCDSSGNIILNSSQNLTCTITNDDIPPTLTVIKNVVGGSSTISSFSLSASSTFSSAFIALTSGVTTTVPTAGVYAIVETTLPGYIGTFDPGVGQDCDSAGIVNLTIGSVKVCILTNTYTPPAPTDADLSITKSVSTSTPNEGGGISYTVTVTNNGPATSTGVIVNDSLPAGLSFVSASSSQGSYSTSTNIWTVGTLSNGASATLTISAIVNLETGGSTIVNTATASSTQADPNSLNNSASASSTVTMPIIPGAATGTITVVKLVVNDNSGTATSSDFNLFVNSTSVVNGIPMEFASGTYAITETGSSTGSYTAVFSGACDSSGNIILNGGQNLTCTITNNDNAPSGGGGGGGGTTVTVTASGGGGGGGGFTPTPEVAGTSTTATPPGEVLGEQTSVVPTGAPNTGSGGTAGNWLGLMGLLSLLFGFTGVAIAKKAY